MWAVYKNVVDQDHTERRIWYVGIYGEWSIDSARAARWPYRQGASFVANYLRGRVLWLSHTADHTETGSGENMLTIA
jgi:hypothetical protein